MWWFASRQPQSFQGINIRIINAVTVTCKYKRKKKRFKNFYDEIQYNFSGSNTDGLFTTAVFELVLESLRKNPIAADMR